MREGKGRFLQRRLNLLRKREDNGMVELFTQKLERFYAKERKWQGIPGVERTAGGRWFATFYSGGTTEQVGNYCVLLQSDDDGAHWSEPVAVAYSGEESRCYDPCLWLDPLGRLWFVWAVSPELGVWFSRCDRPDAATLVWTAPRLFAHDVMMNKPIVCENGDWLFPCAVWKQGITAGSVQVNSSEKQLAYVYRTQDQGCSFERLGGVDMPGRSFDEHMVVELKDHTLLMLVRTSYGIGKSYSTDGGLTWSAGEDSGLGGPNSRFFIRRLSSGRLLLVNHWHYTGEESAYDAEKTWRTRNNLTAMLSDDDGRTWKGFLLLDSRDDVSYPDGVEGPAGIITIIYDRERQGAKEILTARITEDDILAGRLVNPASYQRKIVSRLP